IGDRPDPEQFGNGSALGGGQCVRHGCTTLTQRPRRRSAVAVKVFSMYQAGGPGRIYRSEHAHRTRHPDTTVPLPEPDTQLPPPVSPPDQPASPEPDPVEAGGSTAGNSAVMAIGSLVSRITGFLRTV